MDTEGKENEFQEDIKINRFRLDEEWERNPVLYDKWSKLAAAAERERMEADVDKDILRAKLYRRYRLDLAHSGEKYTDALIDACVKTDPEYRKAVEELIAMTESASIMLDKKWAFQQRKTSLEEIQQGILSGLYAKPNIMEDAEKAREGFRR